MGLMVGILGGGLLSWLVTHLYYQRSVTSTPPWAKDLIDRFGQEEPSAEQLRKYFNEAVASGDIVPHVPSGYVMCPQCKVSSDNLVYGESQYPGRDAFGSYVKCSKCGWSEFLGDV